jgi:SAM-dependent methyltransferase
MSSKPPQNVAEELAYQARQAELAGAVRPTPPETIQRYREHKHWRLFHREYVFHLVKQFNPRHICDFGCGAGETSTELGALGYRVTGFDLSPDLLAAARRRAELDGVTDKVSFTLANAHDPNLGGQRFDLVLAQAILHHIDIHEGLSQLNALVEPGGVVILQEPVAYSRLLQWMRDRAPVEKDISPNERQLNQVDIRAIEERFEVIERRHFHLATRLMRIVPEKWGYFHRMAEAIFWRVDFLLLNYLPGATHFAGVVVMACRKRK